MPYTPSLGARPEDLAPNTFEPVGAPGIASETEVYTLYQRPIPEQMWLFERHANYVGFATLLRMMGFGMGTSTPTVGHFENPWNHDLLHVGSVVADATSAGESATIAIDATAHYDTGATVSGSGRQATYPVVGDVIELFNGIQVYVESKDTSVTPHQLVLTPLKAADDITGVIQSDDKFGIVYNLHAEASGLPSGRVPRIIRYTNTLGVVKHSFGSTGHELTNSVYHELIPGQPGTAGQAIEVKIKADEIIRYEHAKSGLLLFGQQADNITSAPADNRLGIDVSISGTEGFLSFATTSGTVDTYTVGSYDLTDFDTAAAILLNERSAAQNDIMGWVGPDFFTEVENLFTNILINNLIHTVDRIVPGYEGYMNQQYHQGVTQNALDAALSFGYTAVRKNGFIFHLKRLSEFNDIRRLGGDSYEYRNWAVWYPLSWTRDALSGANRPSVGYEYKALGAYSRENLFGKLPGAGVGADNSPYGQPVIEFDVIQYFLMAHCGFHGAVGNAIVVQNPA